MKLRTRSFHCHCCKTQCFFFSFSGVVIIIYYTFIFYLLYRCLKTKKIRILSLLGFFRTLPICCRFIHIMVNVCWVSVGLLFIICILLLRRIILFSQQFLFHFRFLCSYVNFYVSSFHF